MMELEVGFNLDGGYMNPSPLFETKSMDKHFIL